VSSIQALTRLLLDRADGDLTPEQSRQVAFIRKAADGLAELVNDLLDLAKVESGRSRSTGDFDVPGLFGTLRGMLRPLLVNDAVNLVFDDVEDLPRSHRRGEGVADPPQLHLQRAQVHRARRGATSRRPWFRTRGDRLFGRRHRHRIAPEDQDRIFEEFTQVDSRLQRHVKGTGGSVSPLPKSRHPPRRQRRRRERARRGSTFRAIIRRNTSSTSRRIIPRGSANRIASRIVLLQYDSEIVLFYKKLLSEADARSCTRTRSPGPRGLEAASPRLLLLDLSPGGADGLDASRGVEASPKHRSIR
jgi:hypothetical protein